MTEPRYTVHRLPVTPRDRLEAERELGRAQAEDPERASQYELRFTTGGWIVVRLEPT